MYRIVDAVRPEAVMAVAVRDAVLWVWTWGSGVCLVSVILPCLVWFRFSMAM